MIMYMTPTHLMDWSRTCQHQANHMIGGCQSLPHERKRASRSLQKHFIHIFDFFFYSQVSQWLLELRSCGHWSAAYSHWGWASCWYPCIPLCLSCLAHSQIKQNVILGCVISSKDWWRRHGAGTYECVSCRGAVWWMKFHNNLKTWDWRWSICLLPERRQICNFITRESKTLPSFSFSRCRYSTSSQLREGRRTQRRGSSHFSQVIALRQSSSYLNRLPY